MTNPLEPTTRTAAEVLVAQLRLQDVTRVFCVPGESYLPVLDAQLLHQHRRSGAGGKPGLKCHPKMAF